MFNKTKNIDSAFRDIRLFTLAVVAGAVLLSGYAISKSFSMVRSVQQKIYVLSAGKAMEAYAAERRDNIPVEARDHVRTFHYFFFNLDPDDKVILENMGRALYLADQSAKREYDNLKEKGYYNNIISGNVSQRIHVDSVTLNLEEHPYAFRCYGSMEIIRSTSIVKRNLVTEGFLRNVARSDANAHGFLIEGWRIVENNDVSVKQRQ